MGTRDISLQLPLSSTQTGEASLRKRRAHQYKEAGKQHSREERADVSGSLREKGSSL